jgi:poly(hydroxyalkanoate) depolymerase family esterase
MLGVTVVPGAKAASLQQVNNWGGAGLPSDVTMYIYVPDKVATNPPILTLVHYCGGSAPAVFGQAQGGGLVSAANQYGFIMVVPDNGGRCWDVESNKAWTRSGGGDSDAIKQMVTYALSKHSGNANRVYSTGDSSGAMMTELLLALYPDIFIGGSAFAGMPAGCRGTNESSTSMGYSGACAGGNVTHTGAQWGALVEMMDPGYAGHRPRVQLFHGSADPTISPANFDQAIVEWTDVLGLNTNPTTTTMGVTLGSHQATRQQWQSSCGYVVLDTFLSIGGDHGPSDALFDATYVVPFLGLDQTGAADPEIAKCGNTGMGGGTGAAGAGGSGGAAGRAGGRGGGAGSGNAGAGGVSGGAGGLGAGGSASTGGMSGGGGAQGKGGDQGSGGNATGGNSGGRGGLSGSGGMGGNAATGGDGGAGSGGAPGGGGAGGNPTGGAGSGSSGCGCALAAPAANESLAGGIVVLGLALVAGSRARRRKLSRRAPSG